MKKYLKEFTPTPKSLLWGFTFIEILIALTIFAIVAVSLYSTFFSGTSVWKRSEDENRIYQEARWSLDTIAKELRNAIILDYSKSYPDFIIFEGNPDSISFFNATDEGIRKISYFLESDNFEILLKRKEISLIDSLQSLEEETPTETFSSLVAEGGLQFSYAYAGAESEEGIEWQDVWQDPENLPKGVRIKLVLKDPSRPELKTTFNKTVFIPMGIIFEAAGTE
ncbi:MAG: prepilin-type N-terminal cleavage/methylation domain-containing protein [Candidatus Omnitrophota bacterium]